MKINYCFEPRKNCLGEEIPDSNLRVQVGSLCVGKQKIPFTRHDYKFILDRSPEDYEKTKKWIISRLLPYMTRKTENRRHSSYGIKHVVEREIGSYVSNAEIKLILAELEIPFWGSLDSPNMLYPISENFYKSPDRKVPYKLKKENEYGNL